MSSLLLNQDRFRRDNFDKMPHPLRYPDSYPRRNSHIRSTRIENNILLSKSSSWRTQVKGCISPPNSSHNWMTQAPHFVNYIAPPSSLSSLLPLMLPERCPRDNSNRHSRPKKSNMFPYYNSCKCLRQEKKNMCLSVWKITCFIKTQVLLFMIKFNLCAIFKQT